MYSPQYSSLQDLTDLVNLFIFVCKNNLVKVICLHVTCCNKVLFEESDVILGAHKDKSYEDYVAFNSDFVPLSMKLKQSGSICVF